MGSISESSEISVPGIIDIRSDAAGIELKQLIRDGLTSNDSGEKTLPTLLLYDSTGLKLFEKITYLDQYYLTGEEISLLERYADRIAEKIPAGAMVVELGSGNLRKVKILLDALERAGKKIDYYALDLMESELARTLAAVPTGAFVHVQCHGLWGTYDDGLDWLNSPENVDKPKTILSLGSSIGNFDRSDAVAFVAQFASILKPTDSFLCGIDACQEPDRVFHAYNDRDEVTRTFTKNGLRHANTILGYEAFPAADWDAHGAYDVEGGKHQAFVIPQRDVEVEGISLQKGEMIRIEESHKYNRRQATRLWADAGVIEASVWTNESGDYGLHLLQRPVVMFPFKPEQYAPHPVPSLAEWHGLWALWDKVTQQMIPQEELFRKPIKLRNACIFYLGHIPTFLDIKLSEASGMQPTEPAYFRKIFERGIDPDVDNPEECHAHSEIPETWPELDSILNYQDAVRRQVKALYDSKKAYDDNWLGRALWLGFEHEVMHMETLLYMLMQSDKTLPPNGTVKPDFEQLAARARREAVENEWFTIPEQHITIGLDDPDSPDGPVRYFGWDVEKPSYTLKVPSFKAQGRPITIGEYARYLLQTKNERLPTSWTVDTSVRADSAHGELDRNGDLQEFIEGKAVRTVYGSVPLKYTLDWPVSASYDELNGCARYMGGRIPTMEEARSIYEHAAVMKKREAGNATHRNIPAVNGHLVNNGVQETPPAAHAIDSSVSTATPDSEKLFVDLEHTNIGFKNWHPMPVTRDGNKLAGQAEMGGLWEWTSSVLEKRDGFEPMKLYPAYSADFYDEKHNIILGGSWATHPRFAGRKTAVNWYQRNYPFVWAGARLVRDA